MTGLDDWKWVHDAGATITICGVRNFEIIKGIIENFVKFEKV